MSSSTTPISDLAVAPRAKKAKGRKKAEEILEAAAVILIEEGYVALSMRAVAARAGITIGNLQYYFPTKDELWKALLMREAIQFEQSQTEWLTHSTKGDREWPLLQAINYLLVDQKKPRSCSIYWELWALSSHDADADRVMRDIYALYVSKIQELIMLVNEKLSRQRAGRNALIIVSLIEGISLFRGGQRPPFPYAKGMEQDIRDVILSIARKG